MDIGLGLWTMRAPAGFPSEPARRYADLLTDARLAEELGFHSLWVAEHHFSPDGWCPAPLVAAAAVLAATTRLHVGTGIHLLPLYDPRVALAEVRWLADMSGGRFEHGVGIGYRAEEYEGYGLQKRDRGKRMDAALEVFADSPAPIWMGGMAEPALARAARVGCNLLLPSTLRDEQLARIAERATARVGVMKYTWVADDPREAIAFHKAFTRDYVRDWFPGMDSPEKVEAQLDRAVETGWFGPDIAARVGALERLGADLVVLHLVGDGRHPDRHDVMRHIAKELL
jgi:alkanesulfonate monooxygenase SsuD/methylene tetrahydromethanopterin reductase-like flavin-dependent oxidoreductase (luciferase family)